MYSEFIKKLREKADVFENNEYPMEAIVQDYRNCAKVIEYLAERQQPKTDWIPCEERLPSEENEDYLICTNEGNIRILLWTKRGWNTLIDSEGKYYTDSEIKNVIAWQPLPQPYKKEGAEND